MTVQSHGIKILIFPNDLRIISQVSQIEPEDIGEPDCLLTEPFEIKEDLTLTPWLMDFTTSNIFPIHSDKILTIIDKPNTKLIETYKKCIK